MPRIRSVHVLQFSQTLAQQAEDWAVLGAPASLRRYCFRHGVTHLLSYGETQRAEALLADFEYAMKRLESENGTGARPLGGDFATTLTSGGISDAATFGVWESFFRKRAHILARGNDNWSAHKILLQLAVEHADHSPVTAAAEVWLREGRCDWHWLRSIRRPRHAEAGPCSRVLDGHDGTPLGATQLTDGRLLSWARDLRIWNTETGEPDVILTGHREHVRGAIELKDGHLLSWSPDGAVRIWDIEGHCLAAGATGRSGQTCQLAEGRCLTCSQDKILLWRPHAPEDQVVLNGHSLPANGAIQLRDGRLLSWSNDRTLRIWDADRGETVAVLRGHSDGVRGALQLRDGNLLSWSREYRLWDLNGTEVGCPRWDMDTLGGCTQLSDGRLLSWSGGVLWIWQTSSEHRNATLDGHVGRVSGALELPDGRIASCSWDGTIRLWEPVLGRCLCMLEGHSGQIMALSRLADGRLVSCATDGTVRLWDADRPANAAAPCGHTGAIARAIPLAGGLVLSWAGEETDPVDWRDYSPQLWDPETGLRLATLHGHDGQLWATQMSDGTLVTWSSDKTIRRWDPATGAPLSVLTGHTGSVFHCIECRNGLLLSWSSDNTLRLWNRTDTSAVAVLAGHTKPVWKAMEFGQGRLLSWARDLTLRIWDAGTGAPRAAMVGHRHHVMGAVELPDGTLASWSQDGTVRRWDTDSGAELSLISAHAVGVSGAILLEGGRLVTWSSAGSLALWNVLRGERLVTLDGHTRRVLGCIRLPAGRLLSWSADGTLRVWDELSGAMIAVLRGHADDVHGALLFEKGTVLSWSADVTLRLWDADTGACLGCWHLADAALNRPDIWAAYCRHSLGKSSNVLVAAPCDSSVAAVLQQHTGMLWHGDGHWTVQAVSSGGAVTATSGCDIAFLHLYHSAHRAHLDQALVAQHSVAAH